MRFTVAAGLTGSSPGPRAPVSGTLEGASCAQAAVSHRVLWPPGPPPVSGAVLFFSGQEQVTLKGVTRLTSYLFLGQTRTLMKMQSIGLSLFMTSYLTLSELIELYHLPLSGSLETKGINYIYYRYKCKVSFDQVINTPDLSFVSLSPCFLRGLGQVT